MRVEMSVLVAGWAAMAIAFFCGLFAIWTTGPIQEHLWGSCTLFGVTGFALLLTYFFMYEL